MDVACILTSTGEVIATLAIIILIIGGPDLRPRLMTFMLVLAFVGAASCAAEDRVCKLAQMETTP
jgi:hypothetical protein